MASKTSHVQDNSVVERRLRPIYEWLDSGNNKKALQECDKVLKKTPHLQCAKALKALSLLRSGKELDCVNVLNALSSEKLTDESTLQAMTLCYRELQQLDKICDLYKIAIEVDPTNEELHTHLFMSYVRIADFKLQQQAAMTLYKFKPKNPYYCWAVMSIVLQATRGPGMGDHKKCDLLLSLAERMINKMINDNKVEAEHEVQLYIMILELQQKYEEILNVFDGPLGKKLINGCLACNRLPYFLQLNKWADVNLLCKNKLLESADSWDFWKSYLKSVFKLMMEEETNNHTSNHCDTTEDELETIDNTPEKAHEFICRLVEHGAGNGFLLRGPYLARFELCAKLVEHKMNTNDLLGDTIELFIEYFRKFGHKTCCVDDLVHYLKLLDNEKKSDLSVRLIKDVGISSTSVPQTIQQMYRHISALQISRVCGSHRNFSLDHLKALVAAFSLHYQHGFQSYGTDLLPTDQGPSDAYALLAAHVLYDLAQLTKSSEHLILAIVLLENLLKNSPSSFHAKLLCVKLYHCLGGACGAKIMFDILDIKHLQLDSLGYIHCARLSTTGLYTMAGTHYINTIKFFSSNYKDSSDHITFSYKYGSFSKVEEFMKFREHMNNSIHYASISVERVLLNIVMCTKAENLFDLDLDPRDTPIEWDKLRDNSDFDVYASWDPELIECIPSKTQEVKNLFEQNVHFLKLRYKILLAAMEVTKIAQSIDGTRSKHIENLQQILKDWNAMQTLVVKNSNCVPITQALPTLPLPSRLHSFLEAPYLKVLGQLFYIIECIASESQVSENTKDIQNTVTETVDKVKNKIEEQNNSKDIYWEKRTVMENVVNTVEILCMSSILIGFCYYLSKPKSKKTKKKASDLKVRELLNKLNNNLKENINNLVNCLEQWKESNDCDLADMLSDLSLNSDGYENVLNNLKNSHIIAVKELKNVLKLKVRYLESLL